MVESIPAWRKPSTLGDEPWLQIWTKGNVGADVDGKWLIPVSREGVDEAWRAVAGAIIDGRHAVAAKVSNERDGAHVILVYTTDTKKHGTWTCLEVAGYPPTQWLPYGRPCQEE